MGIEGIFGSAGVGGVEPDAMVDAASGPTNVSSAAAIAETPPAGEVEPTSAIERLRAGAIDLDGYLDAKVEQAIAPFQGLAAGDVELLRSMLRERIGTDPALVDLVRGATGRIPEPREE